MKVILLLLYLYNTAVLGMESVYQKLNVSGIEGWFLAQRTVSMMFESLMQDKPGGIEAIAEIGLYEGKSFIYMLNELEKGVPAIALDLFEDLQEFNHDHAGLGSAVKLKRNIMTYTPTKFDQVIWKHINSQQITGAEVLKLSNQKHITFFSIDGCHTVDCTLTDLRTALNSMDPEWGVIMLDDFTNPEWPEVALATGIFLREHHKRLAGLAFGENKIYFVSRLRFEYWREKFLTYCKLLVDTKAMHCSDKLGAGARFDNLIKLSYPSDLP